VVERRRGMRFPAGANLGNVRTASTSRMPRWVMETGDMRTARNLSHEEPHWFNRNPSTVLANSIDLATTLTLLN